MERKTLKIDFGAILDIWSWRLSTLRSCSWCLTPGPPPLCQVILASDWSKLITWPEYRPLIGQYKSCDLNTDLWLVQTDQVTSMLASGWSRLITWPEYRPLIGHYKSCDLNTNIWLVLVRDEEGVCVLWAGRDDTASAEDKLGGQPQHLGSGEDHSQASFRKVGRQRIWLKLTSAFHNLKFFNLKLWKAEGKMNQIPYLKF